MIEQLMKKVDFTLQNNLHLLNFTFDDESITEIDLTIKVGAAKYIKMSEKFVDKAVFRKLLEEQNKKDLRKQEKALEKQALCWQRPEDIQKLLDIAL